MFAYENALRVCKYFTLMGMVALFAACGGDSSSVKPTADDPDSEISSSSENPDSSSSDNIRNSSSSSDDKSSSSANLS